MTMSIVLLGLEDANRFANEFSSPLRVVNSCEFAIGTVDGAGDLHGVAVCTDTDNKKTLAVGLFEMINGRAADHFTMFAAGALLVAVPFTILFILGQKFLLQSLAGTGGKE